MTIKAATVAENILYLFRIGQKNIRSFQTEDWI